MRSGGTKGQKAGTAKGLQILIFAAPDDPAAGWERAQYLLKQLPEAVLINKYSSKYSDLEILAKYRIVDTPTVLITSGKETLLRVLQIPPAEVLKQYANSR